MKTRLISIVGLAMAISCFADNSTLLVGTTGDVLEISYKNESGYSGRDISIIQDYAAANQLNVKFVDTHWADFKRDLKDGKYNVIVGGISETPKRQANYYLSKPISKAQKYALIRCTDMQKYTSFADMDNESVVVVVNGGGTNQQYITEKLQHAIVVLAPNKDAARASLVGPDHDADVMINDFRVGHIPAMNSQICVAKIKDKLPGANWIFMFPYTDDGKEMRDSFNKWWQANQNKYN